MIPPTLLRFSVSVTFCLTVLPSQLGAATLDVPGSWATVTSALAAAAPGDTVLVAAGTYAPSTNGEVYPLVPPDGVTLLGAGMTQTILDAEQTGSVFEFAGGSPVVRGLQITGGSADRGGGAQILAGSPEISGCYFYRNQALRRGSGLNAQGTSTPWIHHNVIWESFDSDLQHMGDPHGVQLGESCQPLVEQNLIGRGDSNGLLVGENALAVVRHNILYENGIEGVRGRGICNLGDPNSVIAYNLFFGNVIAAIIMPNPAGGYFNISGAEASALYPDDPIYGNLDGDPQLASPGLMLFQLTATSPAIDAGDPGLGLDPDGTPLDIGPFYYAQPVGAPTAAVARARLLPNVPNPFNPRTRIRYELERPAPVQIEILDLRGRRVRELRSGFHEAGSYEAIWDGADERGLRSASGAYVVRLVAGEHSEMRRIALVR